MFDVLQEQIEIIRKYQQSAPVDVVSIARDLRINVYTAVGDENLSGKIVKSSQFGGESGYAIFVNKKSNIVRQRFTIAHEIAHYLLHKEAIGDGIVEDALYRSGLSNKMEAEANRFAAEILMPWNLINIYMSDGVTIPKLASIFQVSESAMSIRLGVPG